MNILFTICGRAGSKGLKNKNLKMFLGAPLVYYTIASAQLYIDRFNAENMIHVCLSSDSDELIALVLKKAPKTLIIQRSATLSGDIVSKTAVIKDCLHKAESHYKTVFDTVVDLDITSPLRRIRDIKNATDKKLKRKDVDVVFSVTSARRNPYFNMVKKNLDDTVSLALESNYTARQQAPIMFDMNASIYAFEADFLRTNKTDRLFDGICESIEMPDTAVLDIDSEEDLLLMEVMGDHFFKTDGEYGEIAQHARSEGMNCE